MLETSSFSHLFFIFLFGFPLLPPPVVTPPRPSSGIGLCQAVLVLHRLQPSLPAAPTQQTAPHRREYFVDWRVAFTPCFMAVPCYHVQDRIDIRSKHLPEPSQLHRWPSLSRLKAPDLLWNTHFSLLCIRRDFYILKIRILFLNLFQAGVGGLYL